MFQIWKQCIAYSSRVTEQLQVDAEVIGWNKNVLVAQDFSRAFRQSELQNCWKKHRFFSRKWECRIPEINILRSSNSGKSVNRVASGT